MFKYSVLYRKPMYSTSIKQHNRGWTLILRGLTNYCKKLENKERELLQKQ
jgi:hypothetical protein